ncbi:MAG TPA: SpoIIE family protein phosphatase [Bacteroidia bacterium]|jgi:serine phosphatase RsbU (regulator of sigma subunit)/Tfp pilus assembly protein PilF|nr:SpoIIE family protein phosphatase [Bacteroidia bacterium]
MRKSLVTFLFFISFLHLSFSQDQALDSLFKALPKATTDTEKIKTLGQISEICDFSDIQKYCKQILDVAEKNKSTTDKKSKRVFLREKARAYNNFGVFYYTSAKTIDALDYYQKAALILESDNLDNELLNSVYNNIAAIQMQIDELDKALTILRKCLKTDFILGNKSYIGNDYNNLSSLFLSLNNTDSALYYGLKAIAYKEAQLKPNQDNEGVSLITSLTNVSGIYLNQHNIAEAEKHINKACKIAKERADTFSFSTVNYWKARLLMQQKKYADAKTYLIQAVKYANTTRRILNYSLAYRSLYEVSDSLNDYKEALRYYRLSKIYADSSMNISMRKEAEVKQLRFEFETKELYLKTDHEKQMAIQQAKEQKQRILIWAIIAFLVLVSISALFVYKNYLQKKKISEELGIKNHLIEQQKELVEEKQKQIVDSINYAQHIQYAILPDDAEIKSHLKDFFVLYLPKDIVSGDFYWFTAHGPELFFVTVDCTGHGVPGAFLSMIGNTLLNEIVNFKKITDPISIIENLAQGLTNTLSHNKEKKEEFVDGMDISICKINTQTKKLYFSSVNHAAYTVNSNGELTQLSPQVKSVHGIFAFADRKDVGVTELSLSPGTMVYMGTDGYGDQVGEQTKKKLMAPKVKELLSQIHNLPIDQQKIALHKTFVDWKGTRKQNDDILVMGFRIS